MQDNETLLKEIFMVLVSGLLRHPADLVVSTKGSSAALVIITATAHGEDTPRLIGQGGAMIAAIKVILEETAAKRGCAVAFRLLEPVKGERSQPAPFTANPRWLPGPVMEMTRKVGAALFDGNFIAECKHHGDASTVVINVDHDDASHCERIESALSRVMVATGKVTGRRLAVRVVTEQQETTRNEHEPDTKTEGGEGS